MEIPRFQKKVHINCKKYIRSLKIKKNHIQFKGTRTRFGLKFLEIYFLILICFFKCFSKIETQLYGYKQVTNVNILCFVKQISSRVIVRIYVVLV